MKYFYLPVFLIALFATTSTVCAQVAMSFENRETTLAETSTSGQYRDLGNAFVAHELEDYAAGLINVPVSSPSSSGVLGFRSFFRPSRSGASSSTEGLTEGDIFGYAKGAAVSSSVTQPPTDGAQAFMIEDTDGEVSLVFDPVNLNGAIGATFSMDFIVDGSFEADNGANDRFFAILEVTGCPAATTVVLLDTDGDGVGGGFNSTGNDLDAAQLPNGTTIADDTWYTLSADLSPYALCAVQLKLEADFNSSTEELAIDNIVFSAGLVLPVEFTDFSATPGQKEVNLNWVTASEDGNRGFSVERSMDGTRFSPIGWVDGNGTTNEEATYHFRDDNVTAGAEYYYRLRQEDFDGAFAYSTIEMARINGAVTAVQARIFPNPATNGRTTLEVFAEQSGTREVSVFDLSGRRVINTRHNLAEGINLIDLDVQPLKPGAYLVRVAGGGQTQTIRISR